MTLADLRAKRDDILRLAEARGVYNVRVFGSVARGEATADSDVDLLVSAKSHLDMFDLVGLWLDLQELLVCDVSLVTDGIPDKQFLETVQDDVVAL
ncbi:MAG: nucleotidyltransferase domain-containing protein [Anaerolineae bacterium]|nr:nucleotidyltransferase domain-containing protein [Anaerolineae bacterium]